VNASIQRAAAGGYKQPLIVQLPEEYLIKREEYSHTPKERSPASQTEMSPVQWNPTTQACGSRMMYNQDEEANDAFGPGQQWMSRVTDHLEDGDPPETYTDTSLLKVPAAKNLASPSKRSPKMQVPITVSQFNNGSQPDILYGRRSRLSSEFQTLDLHQIGASVETSEASSSQTMSSPEPVSSEVGLHRDHIFINGIGNVDYQTEESQPSPTAMEGVMGDWTIIPKSPKQ